MKIVETTLLEDFGPLDREFVRAQLLTEPGVRDVGYGTMRYRLSIEYDPIVLDDSRLLEIMCRHGVYPIPSESKADAEPRGDG